MWSILLALLDDELPLLPGATPLAVGERAHIAERVLVERYPIDPEAGLSGPAQRHHMSMEVDVRRVDPASPHLEISVTDGWIDTANGAREPHPLVDRLFVLGPGFVVVEEPGAPPTSEALDRVVSLLAQTVHAWAAVDAERSFTADAASPSLPVWPPSGAVRWADGPALPVNDDAPVWRDASVRLLPARGARRTVELSHEVKDQLASIARTGTLSARATYRARDARLVRMDVAIHDTATVSPAAGGPPRTLEAGTSRARIRVRWQTRPQTRP